MELKVPTSQSPSIPPLVTTKPELPLSGMKTCQTFFITQGKPQRPSRESQASDLTTTMMTLFKPSTLFHLILNHSENPTPMETEPSSADSPWRICSFRPMPDSSLSSMMAQRITSGSHEDRLAT